MFKQQEVKEKDEKKVQESTEPAVKKESEKEAPVNPNDINLKASFKYDDNHLENIENARKAFCKLVKKQNVVKWVVALLAIGLLIFAWAYLSKQEAQALKVTGYCLMGFSLLMLIAYYIISRRFSNKHMKAYLKVYYGDSNAYVFGQDRFSDVSGDVEGKIENADFHNNLLYKNVSTIGSRNLVNFKIDKKYACRFCDLAAQTETTKKLEPLFIGKYLIAPNTYNGDEPIIIYLTGNNRALPPNNVEHLPKVVNTKKMVIYTTNKNYESVVNAKIRQALAQLTTNNVLVDVSISITKHYTYIGLGYDDCLMVLPLQEKFNPLPVDKFKKDMALIAEIIANLNK